MADKAGAPRRFFRFVMLALNVLALLWLSACFTTGRLSPLEYKYLSLFTLTIPFAIVVNIFFVVFWLFARGKWRALISLAALLFFYKTALVTFGWNLFSRNEMASGPQRLKVMSWNVHGMGAFDKPLNNNRDKQAMELIREYNPDILCMPEFYTIYSNALKPYSTTILKQCGYKEFRFKKDNSIGTRIHLGTAVFSKYPLQSFEAIELAKYVYALRADFKITPELTIRGIFLHLQSVRLSDKDKALIEDAKHRERDIGVAKSKNILAQLAGAYQLRAMQAERIQAIIAGSPYPVIVCGDFNDLPGSYCYSTIKGNRLRDAFADKGFGFGRTYNMFSPTLRIDYVLYDPSVLTILGCSTPKVRNISDHNPVIANFEFRAPH